MREQKSRYYEFGEFRLDARKRVLLRNNEPVHLTLKVFQLLLVLVERSGQVLEKNDLMDMVWPDAVVEEANLKNSISTLRKTLGDEPGAEVYIQTLPKRGYRFVAPVTALPDEAETYLVEKRTTAEIIIEEVETLPKPIATGEARARQAIKKRAFGRLTRTQRAATLAVLLIAAAGLSIGLYKWLKTGEPDAHYSFEKMKMIRLANVGNGWAIISPDGKYIVYYQASGTPMDGLWIRQTVTDSAIQLLPPVLCHGATFTPDSNYVYCAIVSAEHPEGALYKIPVFGGPPKLVLERISGGVRFSPDGKRLSFKRMNKEMGRPDLITANIDGSDERIVIPANPRYAIWGSDWSPDGKTIALVVINIAVEGQITWQAIAIPADGGEEWPITAPQKEFMGGPVWLPDGSGFIVVAEDKATGVEQLWRLSYPGGEATRITNDSSTYSSISLTADGGTMLASQVTVTQNLSIADTDDLSNSRKITSDGAQYDYISWATDGRILYTDSNLLWAINADGSGRQRLTDDQSQSRWPRMTPDRRYIVYSSRRNGQLQICRMDSDGRNPRQLTDAINGGSQPSVTPDGQWVVYQTWIATGWTVRKVPIDGGEWVRLAEKGENAVISQDGKMLAYYLFDDKKVVVKAMDESEPIKIIDCSNSPIKAIEQWGKGGLLCISSDATQIILLPLDGTPPRHLTNFKAGERIYSFALSPDGKQVALSLGASKADAVMITNFKVR